MCSIALAIARYLRPPVFNVAFGLARPTLAVMSMPKTTMYEDDLFAAWETQIWLARQFLAVEAIAITRSVQHASH
tara:strand:- start:3388 stop:3612 length:225 start_codon:yes stop_codon:yes gene_type:complete